MGGRQEDGGGGPLIEDFLSGSAKATERIILTRLACACNNDVGRTSDPFHFLDRLVNWGGMSALQRNR